MKFLALELRVGDDRDAGDGQHSEKRRVIVPFFATLEAKTRSLPLIFCSLGPSPVKRVPNGALTVLQLGIEGQV